MSPKLSPEPCSLNPPSARYHNSALSIWLSVDPMSDKYPSTSPYTYCANNPVKLVDPNGKEIWIDGYRYVPGQNCPEGVDVNTQQKWNSLNTIYGKKNGQIVIDEISSSDYQLCISSEINTKSTGSHERGDDESGTIYLNGHNNDIVTLSHELFHGYQHMNGQSGHTLFNEIEATLFSFSITGDINTLLCTKDCPEKSQYNNSILALCYGDSYNQSDFDFVHDLFTVCSPANWKKSYNTYSTIYPDCSLISRFYPLSDFSLSK